MPRHWIEPTPVEIPPDLAALNLPPIVAATLVRRGITTAEAARAFLDPDPRRTSNPFDLPDMSLAVERLRRAFDAGERILVWGDFDVDGQTATALLVSALRSHGATVSYHIPDREREGHGISTEVLTEFLDGDQPPAILLTCDTGIAAHEAILLANTRGVDVIVTDHHNLPDELPPALANLNPRRLPPDHAMSGLPGVGVAYMLMTATALKVWNGDLAAFHDLVALGIVADVAPLTGDTRTLLKMGLSQLRGSQRPGIAALIELSGINPLELSEEQIGFALAPRLNALGRLSNAAEGVELLLSQDITEARTRAVSVEQLNAYRKLLTEAVTAAARTQVEADRTRLDPPILVLSGDTWNPGVVGIVANRLVDAYNRPVIIFGGGEQGAAVLKGSARSTAGIDITAAITRAAHDNPGLILRFGGHPMAAGLSVERERIQEFRGAVNRAAKALGVKQVPPPALEIAEWVTLDQITLELADAISQLAPFGAGNPPLTLGVRDVRISFKQNLGRSGEHLRITVQDSEGTTRRVLWWNGAAQAAADPDLLPEEIPVDLAFTARTHDYKGKREIQVEWVEMRPAAGAEAIAPRRKIEVIDMRAAPDPLAALREITAKEPDVILYAEVNLPGVDQPRRFALPLPQNKSAALIIWTAPPSRRILDFLLSAVSPQRVYWLAHDPQIDALEPFVKRLAGLVKYARDHKNGQAGFIELAQVMAHEFDTVESGLKWLHYKGLINMPIAGTAGIYHFSNGSGIESEKLPAQRLELQSLLAEAAAYRQYLRTADIEAIRRQML